MIREAPIEHDGRRYVVIFEDYKLAGFARGAKVKTRTIFSLRQVEGEDLLAVAVGEHDPRFGCCRVDAWVAIPRAVLAKCNEAHRAARKSKRDFQGTCCRGGAKRCKKCEKVWLMFKENAQRVRSEREAA